MGINNVKLSTRIYFQQIMVVLALIGLGLYALNNLRIINDYAVELADDDFPVLQENIQINEKISVQEYELLTLRYAALLHILADSDSKKATRSNYETARVAYLAAEKDANDMIRELGEHLEKLLMTEDEAAMIAILKEFEGQLEVVENNQKKISQLALEVEKVLDLEDEAGLNKLLAVMFAVFKESNKDAYKLVEISQNDILRSIHNSKDVSSAMVDMLFFIVITVSLIAIALTVITGMSLRTLRKSVDVISGSVQQVATAAAQSGNAISMVSDGAKRQSDSINQAVTAVEQSVSVLAEVSKSAEEATELAKSAGALVRAGKDKMDAMVRVVNRIEENSNRVNKITEIIGGIASQTNMLALNAAIEAARAGEQGKGFAVVADQVKSLAENSKSSVDDIVTLIEQAKADASEAVTVANNVNQEMQKILESSLTTERMMQNISTAMEEQVSTTEELGQNMDTLRDIGNSNANAAEEITETIIELSRIASDTNQEIKKFNI